MDKADNEIVDSQLCAEHVGFLDYDFGTSFDLEKSLVTLKQYISEEENEFNNSRINKIQQTKLNASIQSNSLLETSVCSRKLVENIKKYNNLKDWGLPIEITKKYAQRGISEMFDWQVECLSNSKVLIDCCNLVYSAPTSAGKTLVAEILTIKTILERQKKVIIILPFVSIVREKMFYLQDILSSSGIRVEGFMGSQSPPGGLQAVHVAVCTIEKGNSLINRLIDDGNMSELGAVIVDELHLVGDPNRGYILELLLTKIKYISSKYDHLHIQIVGMSATLPNLEVLAKWLGAELFITNFRPIPLDEYCLVGSHYYDKYGKHISTLKSVGSDSDNILEICFDTINIGCSVLIFCMTKNRCENVALSISSKFYQIGNGADKKGIILRNQLNSDNILEVLEQLRNCPVGLDDILKKSISFGVAYHHAGLTFDERDIIEWAFKSGAIRVLVATSTLSSGVNLPARKVIIRTPVFQRQPINILTYKQMVGRAGRMGKDTKGESILFCSEAEKKIGFDLMMGVLNPVVSCIESEDKYMRAVLEMIASQVVFTKEELNLYSKCTLLYAQKYETISQTFLLQNTIEELKKYELIRMQMNGGEIEYVATPLGKACLSSSLAPNDGLSLFCELQRARQCLVLETDLHLIYLVTPYSVSSQWGEIDWLHLLTLWENLTKAMKRVGELVGVQENFIICCLRGTNKVNKDINKINIHKRFYTALALQDLVNEIPLSEVATKFQCARGFLQSLQQAAGTFAGMVTAFCRQLGWKNMEMLISQFQDRLHFGIHSDLLELMKLSSLNGTRARALFDAGFETISSIALSDVNIIEAILLKTVPFESEKDGDHDQDDARKRKKIKNIWITGYCGVTPKDAAHNLVAEARKYLEQEIGAIGIKWNTQVSNYGNVSNNTDNNKIILTDQNDDFKCTHFDGNELNTLTKQSMDQHEIYSQNSTKDDRVKDCDKVGFYSYLNTERKINTNCNTIQYDKCANTNVKNEVINEIIIVQNNLCKDINDDKNTSLEKPIKNEVSWDSLNFTESAIQNITKFPTVDKIFSPNISFGETEEKMASFIQTDDKIAISHEIENKITNTSNRTDNATHSKCASEKDLSLFSFDSNDVSLFEESISLDSSKVYDSSNKTKSIYMQELSLINGSNNNTSMSNYSTCSLLEKSDENDFKLVYEEDISQNNSEQNDIIELKEDNDFEGSSKRRNSLLEDISQPDVKKRKLEKVIQVMKNIPIGVRFSLKLNNDNSKCLTLELGQYKLSCFLLKGNDNIENLHVINSVQNASIYLNTRNLVTTTNEIIGSNVFRVPKSPDVYGKNNLINGMAIYIGQMKCIFFDFNSVISNYSTIQNAFSTWFKSETLTLKVMALKTVNLYIKKWLDIDLLASCVDISLLEWLTDSDEKIPNILYLVKKYLGVDLTNTYFKSGQSRKRYQNLDTYENVCIKAWAVSMVAEKQEIQLKQRHEHTIDVEIQISKILANCEHYGITVDKELASQLLIDVRTSQENLQKKAFKLCGHHFNFNASKDVAKALGMYNGRKVSTRKSVLTSHQNTLSSIVIFWRKLNSILTKTLYPLTERAWRYSEGNRINPSYSVYTCTGRISMQEPNLQNVPRTFSIPLEYLTLSDTRSDDLLEFNCWNIFKAAVGFVMVSADYCQLEMRLLTHFSEDPVLMEIMKSDVDVFKSIAASWGNIPEDEVDDDLRQKAKQLCYGILYGMGNRTLAQQLDVPEAEAAVFMDSFYKTYPSIRSFTQSVIEECRKKGYVETLNKRRRYISDINSNVMSKRSAAERQAVNTTIQGSAADIAKAAMCAIDTKTNDCRPKPRLILQLHDELIYEVAESDKTSFISVIKQVMEDTIRLRVPLPVKVKSGLTWGTLTEVCL